METGCQNIQLCVAILKVAFSPQVIGPIFLFPLIYIAFQCTEALLMCLCFRCYQRFKPPAEGKCHSCLCVFVPWGWEEGSDQHMHSFHTFVAIGLLNSDVRKSKISPFSFLTDKIIFQSIEVKQEVAKPWQHHRWQPSAGEGNERELHPTHRGCSYPAPSLSLGHLHIPHSGLWC